MGDNDFVLILNDLHKKIDAGFAGVYGRMEDSERKTEARTAHCRNRFEKLEIEMAERRATNGVEKERKKETRETWLYLVRGAALSALVVAAGIAYKMAVLTETLQKTGVLK